MNKLNFGDIIFGGNVQQNLDKEATMNRIINRQIRTKKINKDLFGTTGGNQEVIPTPLRKHMVKKSNQPLTQIFTKVEPKKTVMVNVDSVPTTAVKPPETSDILERHHTIPIVFFADIVSSAVGSSYDSNSPF